jgi:hypothetical protein
MSFLIDRSGRELEFPKWNSQIGYKAGKDGTFGKDSEQDL